MKRDVHTSRVERGMRWLGGGGDIDTLLTLISMNIEKKLQWPNTSLANDSADKNM